MSINNLRILHKVMLVVGLLGLVALGGVGYSSVGMGRIAFGFQQVLARENPATGASADAGKSLSGLLLAAYSQALETRATEKERLAGVIAAAEKTYLDDLARIKALVPDDGARVDAVEAVTKAAFGRCEGPIGQATKSNAPMSALAAGIALKNGCEQALRPAFDKLAELTDHLTARADQAGAALGAETHRTIVFSSAVELSGVIVALLLSFWIARANIAGPLTQLAAAMQRLAGNDLAADIPGGGRKDEIGAMAAAVSVFKRSAVEQVALKEREREKQAGQERRAQAIEDLTARFDRGVNEVLDAVTGASGELQTTAHTLSSAAEKSAGQATTVAAAAAEASVNVQTVASATEELSASTAEITRQIVESARITGTASEEAKRTNELVRNLAQAADRIGEIVQLIDQIAAKTNLLALNATIEAARAGEAGRGFAVVAGEVKSLASQTAHATGEIGQKIAEVQQETRNTVAAIQKISGIIEKTAQISVHVSAAVEQQGKATKEIANSIQQVALGTQHVSGNIGGVSKSASATGSSAQRVLTSANQLSASAGDLRCKVTDFLAEVKVA